jgi:hypothetical protein
MVLVSARVTGSGPHQVLHGAAPATERVGSVPVIEAAPAELVSATLASHVVAAAVLLDGYGAARAAVDAVEPWGSRALARVTGRPETPEHCTELCHHPLLGSGAGGILCDGAGWPANQQAVREAAEAAAVGAGHDRAREVRCSLA